MAVLEIFLNLCFCILLLGVIHVDGNSDSMAGDNSLIIQLLERMSALEERDIVQQKLIVDLQNELVQRDAVHQKDIVGLQKELTNQKKEIGIMKKSLKLKDRRIKKLAHSVKKTIQRFVQSSKMSKGFVEEQGIVRNRRLANEVTVAFSAGLSKTVTHPGINQNIVFDHEEINLGNGYNQHHGVFVAPVSGTYVFFTTIYASHLYNRDHIYCHFVVNGVNKSSLYVESTASSSDTGSQMVITQLLQGDDVAVQLKDIVGGIYSNTVDLLSTFSGFLLQQDFSPPDNILG